MSKEYYYLDGKDQKGPFTVDQLKTLHLNSEALVWEETFDHWKPLKEVDELKILLKKEPPPPPVIDTNVVSTRKTSITNQEIFIGDSNVKLWITVKVLSLSLLLIAVACFLAHYLHIQNKKELKNQIYSEINRVFDGKTVIIDGQISHADGELRETGYKKNDDENSQLSLSSEWWERQKIYTLYEVIDGGFTIKQLTRQNEDGFDIETTYSGDMGYKKPKASYIPPQYIDWGNGDRYKTSDGYWANNFRLSVSQCYRKAYNYYTVDDKRLPGAYSPGKFVDITNFPDIENEFYFMENSLPKKQSASSIFSSEWNRNGYLDYDDWALEYISNGKHYELTEKTEATNKNLFTNLAIGVGSSGLFLIILFLSKPHFFRNLSLFGKRWENESYEDQMFYFEHSMLGKWRFIEITNDKVYKGILRVVGGGNTINLSYPSKELFYEINTIQPHKLILISQKDNSKIEFNRLGSQKEVKVPQDNPF